MLAYGCRNCGKIVIGDPHRRFASETTSAKLTDSQYRAAANRLYSSDEIEIDNCDSVTGDQLVIRIDGHEDDVPDGAWVKAWLWVSNDEAAKESE